MRFSQYFTPAGASIPRALRAPLRFTAGIVGTTLMGYGFSKGPLWVTFVGFAVAATMFLGISPAGIHHNG